MSYSRYFGMRGFENIVRDGRHKVPKTGTPFKIGAPVQLDPANDGFLKAADEAKAPSQDCGLVIYEHIQNKSEVLTTQYDSPYDAVPLGQFAQMMHGPGTKVWFMNTVDKTLYDGRTQVGGALLVAGIDLSTLRGKGLVPDGAGKFRVTDGTAVADVGGDAWLVVEQANPSTGRVEARLTF